MGNIVFELNELESQRAREFAKEHEHCHEGTMGDKLLFSFIPTRIGDIIQIHCMACGTHEEITDMEKF